MYFIVIVITMKPILSKIFLIFFLFFVSSVRGADFIPAITNYTEKDYKGGHQNWACAQGDDGVMYFGNNKGLLVYDGFSWELYTVPGGYIVRSVFVDSDRIYIGSFEEFGYFTRNTDGQMEYHSLSAKIKDKISPNDEIWHIVRLKEKIYFQSFTGWYAYDGKQVNYMDRQSGFRPLYFYTCHEKIYAQMINGDFYKFDGNRFLPFLKRTDVGNDNVVAILPYGNDGMVLLTVDNGLFVYDNGKVSAFHTKIDRQLGWAKGNRAVMVGDSILAIGTILDGIYGLDKKGNLLWHLNRDNRLNNNSVMGLFSDRESNLWAALDDGISFVHTNTSVTLFTPSVKDLSIGMVYGVERVGDKIYLATNQGAYEYDQHTSEIRLLPHTAGQNWYVKHIDSQTFIGNDVSTMLVEQNNTIQTVPGALNSTCIVEASINGQAVLVEASYAELRIWEKANGKWKLSHTVQDFYAPIKSLEVDGTGVIWASHMYSGLYRIKLDDNLFHIKDIEHIHTLGGRQQSGKIHVMKIRGRIVFSNTEGYFIYDDIERKIKPYEQLNIAVPFLTDAHTAVDVHNNDMLWLINSHEYVLLAYQEGQFVIKRRIPVETFNSPCIEGNNKIYVDGNNCYLNLNNSVACLHLNEQYIGHKTLSNLTIRRILASSSSGKELALDVSKKAVISSDYRDISVLLSYPSYDQPAIHFKFKLYSDNQLLTEESSFPSVHFGSLEFGSYTLWAGIYRDDGRLLDQVEYVFVISKPFWISYPMLFLYLLLFGSLVYVVARWRGKTVAEKKRKEYEAHKIEQNIKLSEQQRLIAEQQKKLLEAELSLKGKELASMALGTLAKKDMLGKLRLIVQEQLLKSQCGRKNMELVLKQINENIIEEDSWEVFQKNFDLIHQRFFRTLRERYPNLTATDLRFCAFLRLNLSTKDIAQMTNLTIRGVEAARYRIRKRMEIPDGVSLVDFLIDLR